MPDDVTKKMRVFVDFPEVEDELAQKTESRVKEILLTETKNGKRKSAKVIYDYLDNADWEKRLQVIIGLSGGSLERLKRICEVILQPEQSYAQIKSVPEVRLTIAKFLADSQNYTQVPQFIRDCFYLREDWYVALRDKRQVKALVQNSLLSEYAVRTGFALENRINDVIRKLGLKFDKGQVEMVDNKEVDAAIPTTTNPEILIMSSYALTTSSNQSSRSKEQTLMYDEVQKHNRRKNADVKMLNVIDGGGWLARRNDLKTMVTHCDRAFAHADIVDGTFEQYLRENAKGLSV